MHHSLATLLWSSILIYACYVESMVGHHHEKRVLTATDLFRFVPEGAPGGCTQNQITLLSSWIADAVQLNNAALSAYGFGLGAADAVHLANIMGINTNTPFHLQSDEDRELYQFVGHRLGIVQQFLTGNGLFEFPGALPPYFFCNDGFAQYISWNQPARDITGQNILNRENGNMPFTIGELFPDFVGALTRPMDLPVQPFWIARGNMYYFGATDDTHRMCYGDLLASTPFPVPVINDVVFHGLDLHSELNRQPRFIFFCDNGWNSRGPWHAALGNLAEITQYNNYPADGNREQDLEVMIPISATFYHELFHLTDTPTALTSDYFMGAARIFAAPMAGIDARKKILDNPESYCYFAVASYLVRHAPQTPAGAVPKPPVVYFGGIPAAVR